MNNDNGIDRDPMEKQGCVTFTNGQRVGLGCAVFMWTLVLVPMAIIVVGGLTESIGLGFIAAFAVVVGALYLFRVIGKGFRK